MMIANLLSQECIQLGVEIMVISPSILPTIV
jgi:hypothetical protein